MIDFGAPRASLTEFLSKCSLLLLPFSFQVRFILVGFCQRHPRILKTHCFGLVAGDKSHDIADHFSYAGSRCHNIGGKMLKKVLISGYGDIILVGLRMDMDDVSFLESCDELPQEGFADIEEGGVVYDYFEFGDFFFCVTTAKSDFIHKYTLDEVMSFLVMLD